MTLLGTTLYVEDEQTVIKIRGKVQGMIGKDLSKITAIVFGPPSQGAPAPAPKQPSQGVTVERRAPAPVVEKGQPVAQSASEGANPPSSGPKPEGPAQSGNVLQFCSVDELWQSLKADVTVENGRRKIRLEIPESEVKRIEDWFGGSKMKGINLEPKAGQEKVVALGFYKGKGILELKIPSKWTDNKLLVFMALKALGCQVEILSETKIGKLRRAQMRAATYLTLSLDEEVGATFNDVMSRPEFLPELVDKDFPTPPIEEFTKCPLEVYPGIACFLVEIFCDPGSRNPQEPREVCNYDKRFANQKCIYDLSLLAPLPVAFEYDRVKETVVLTFADTEVLKAEAIRQQVDRAMIIFPRMRLATAWFQHVDLAAVNLGDFKTISEDLNVAIVKQAGMENPQSKDEDIIDGAFCVWCYPVIDDKSGQEARQLVREKFQKVFEKCQVWECEQCHKAYSGDKNRQGCIVYSHNGHQEPFSDGQWEHTEYDTAGREIKFVRYSCCDEVPEDDPGCLEAIFPSHVPAQSTPSVFRLE